MCATVCHICVTICHIETDEIWDQDKMNRDVANVSEKQTEFKKAQKMFTVSKISLRR